MIQISGKKRPYKSMSYKGLSVASVRTQTGNSRTQGLGTSLLGISSDYSHRGGFAMSPNKFDWSLLGAIVLVILILLVVVVALFQ